MGLLSDLPLTDKKGWPWEVEVTPDLYEGKNIEWPRISIVTPSYNQGQFIEETIRSILLQNYPNLEYIIMDGGSTDNSREIIEKYSSFINYWESGKDEGQSDALVKGFNRANGEILNWINSDDILDQQGLYHIARTFIDNPGVSFVHGKNGIVSIGSDLTGYMPHPKDQLDSRYLCEMPYGQQACFFRAGVYREAGGINRSLRFSMDYELFAKMHLLDIKSLQIDQLIGSVRIHPDTKTSNLEEIMRYENGNSFLTLLLSAGDLKNAAFFRKLGFVQHELYKVKKKIPVKILKTAILLFLKKNIWYYYNRNDHDTALRMGYRILLMEPKNIFNTHYLKIIKDGTIKILQPGRPG
jgi:glycosyltransferase involved in cell wall biosynthesis